jgi:hypothetical protein
VDRDYRDRRAHRSAEGSLTSGLIFTFAFGLAWILTGKWFFIFPLIFAGVLPAMEGFRRLVGQKTYQRDLSINRGAREEKQILLAAREARGVVTPALVALKTDLSIERAEQILEQMARKGYAEMRVNPGGRIEYTFPEFLPEPEPRPPERSLD